MSDIIDDRETGIWVECALDGCTELFLKKVHNQRFHGRECCRVYTNARILAAYHSKKNKVIKGRVCKSKGCDTLLSRYNEDEHCSVHQQELQIEKLRNWGWEVDEFGNRVT